jgi:hypothetical protein
MRYKWDYDAALKKATHGLQQGVENARVRQDFNITGMVQP